MSCFDEINDYFSLLIERIRLDHYERRHLDNSHCRLNALLKPKKGVLAIDKIYFYAKNNAHEHRTVRYELIHRQPETCIVRRGSDFTLAIRFLDGAVFDPDRDRLRLHFDFGPAPNPADGTQAVLKVTAADQFIKDKKEWDVRCQSVNKDTAVLQVQIPANAPVGLWRLRVLTDLKESTKPNVYDCKTDIYILFNPWCEDDNVHMNDADQLLDEYVLADTGKIWMGSYGSAQGREWVYGQYDDASLPVTVYLLERSGLPHAARSDPVLVTRALTKMVNSNDGDGGILHGRWDGDYDDGTPPSAWTGSVKILEDYLLTRRPVKYGQCWVFAGVLTTETLTIDRYYSADNEELDYDPFNLRGGKDSIWNFHVWVEAWMSRPDLPKGYGGWQAIDATPQERSGGYFQCGPASVEAVKNGQVQLPYDVPFVLAEVNADVVRWHEDKSSETGFTRISTNNYKQHWTPGLTKKASQFDRHGGSRDVDDITLNYKSTEGSREERIALFNAVSGSENAKRFHDYPVERDVSFDLIELERVPIGESFAVTVLIENRSSEIRSINAILSATSHFYTGIKANEVKRATGMFILQPNAREELRLPVSKNEYLSKLVEYGMMKLSAMASVKETKQTWVEEDDFQVLMPHLLIQVADSKVKRGSVAKATINFTNSLGLRLTGCKLHYEGPGLCRPHTMAVADVMVGETLSQALELPTKYAGEHSLVVTFSSREFTNIAGSTTISVEK